MDWINRGQAIDTVSHSVLDSKKKKATQGLQGIGSNAYPFLFCLLVFHFLKNKNKTKYHVIYNKWNIIYLPIVFLIFTIERCQKNQAELFLIQKFIFKIFLFKNI